jgi:hypothetical protein
MNVGQSIGTRMGTAGGTLLTVIVNISSGDLTRTVVLATIGAVVSFSISLLLKIIIKWLTGKPPDLIE